MRSSRARRHLSRTLACHTPAGREGVSRVVDDGGAASLAGRHDRQHGWVALIGLLVTVSGLPCERPDSANSAEEFLRQSHK